jgi:hypothetical protein
VYDEEFGSIVDGLAIALALAVLGAALKLNVDSGTNESRPS